MLDTALLAPPAPAAKTVVKLSDEKENKEEDEEARKPGPLPLKVCFFLLGQSCARLRRGLTQGEARK